MKRAKAPDGDVRAEIGQQIEHYRKERGLSQERLAAMVGTVRDTVRRFETGERTPGADILMRFAVVLGVSVEALMPEDYRGRYAPFSWLPLPTIGQGGDRVAGRSSRRSSTESNNGATPDNTHAVPSVIAA